MIWTLSRGWLVACCLAAPGFAADRPADEIVAQIDAIQVPDGPADSKTGDAAKKAELIGELLKAHPADPRLARLLPERWDLLDEAGAVDRVTAEVDAVLAAKTSDPAVRIEAGYYKAELLLDKEDCDPATCLAAVEAFLKLAPKDKRAGMLLYEVAYNEPDVAKRVTIEDRILKDHRAEQFVEMIEGDRRQRDQIGRPFELSFTDAIGGQVVSMERLRGKVVVVDFWATWCGPCVDSMPKMKRIYAKYKDKGVEFIGISLDKQGDLPKLKKFVAENGIAWPQFYEGKRFESELVTRWDISGIPTVFVVDRDGKLASVKGVLGLEAILDGLLKEPAKGAAGGH
jgi:thiol-disulfide isomerase/thioredoxin